MSKVIDLGAWRLARAGHPAGRSRRPDAEEVAVPEDEARAGHQSPPTSVRLRPIELRASGHRNEDEQDLDRLEQAVQRLHPLVSEALGGGRRLEDEVETELLAIMGELTVGLVREATTRTDRLAARLAAHGGAAKA